MNINEDCTSWGICLGFISLVIQYWKKRNICLTFARPDNFGMCQAFPVKGQEIAQLVWGAQQRSGKKVSTCKAWYLMRLPSSSSRPNPTFSSQPIMLWDRMIQETQETTDFLDFLWNNKTVIHWNLWGWQLGTVRSTSAPVGVPGALSCVCHMSHTLSLRKEMRFKTLLIWDVRRQWSDFFSSVKVVAIFEMMGVSKFGQDNLRN